MTITDLAMKVDVPSGKILWHKAACRNDPDKEAWFPFPSESFGYAARVCATCPIRKECNDFAQKTRQSGVWGGNEFDRGQLIR